MSHTYRSKIIRNKCSQELAICVINSSGNPIDFARHKLTEEQAYLFDSAKKGAHHFGVKGWTLDPADPYQGYAEKALDNLG